MAANKIATVASGATYIQECKDSGVPVPDTVIDIDNGWSIFGQIAHPFMFPELKDARLWTFEDSDGICMALPRASEGGAHATVVGVICMGWNGRTCYFTNPANTSFDSIEPIGIEELIGGSDLIGAEEGECSDCHAGENPFVVHPDDPEFKAALAGVSRHTPDQWPTPIVPDLFPGNPEPIEKLGPVSQSQSKCDTCHIQGVAGRFPLVSSDYPGYCSEVLSLALGQDESIPNTMPPSGYDIADFDDHAGWLLAACDAPPAAGVVVPFFPPHFEVLPPDVEAPYACSKHVRVTNAIFGATLKLYVNWVEKGNGIFRDPHGGHVFELVAELKKDDIVGVTQSVGGALAQRTVKVRDHTEDFPNGLPKPIISPQPLYKCAKSIAVVNVPGVEMTISRTDPNNPPSPPYVRRTGYSHTWFANIGGAFAIGTSFKVQQKLCSDISPWSDGREAEAEPAVLPHLTLEQTVVGQPLVRLGSIVQGASIELVETNAATVLVDSLSVPFNSWRFDVATGLGGPLQATHDLAAQQGLCSINSGSSNFPPPAPCNEETLVPAIARPHHGDDFVLVTYAVPGSNVRVFDALTELGNGSSDVIGLSRTLKTGEVIFVVAELDSCSVDRAYAVIVL